MILTEAYAYYTEYTFAGASFFTMVLLPQKNGKFPVVIKRSPYVAAAADQPKDALLAQFQTENEMFAAHGYAVVFQHCRGCGKSSGDFIPYIIEREDGLALRKWIRKQDFYSGQLLLLGGSYTASLHYSTAPFEKDILGAVFNVQDSERYRLWYRNGILRIGHANWYFGLYKKKSNLKKNYTWDSFFELPLKNLSRRALGERADDVEGVLAAPDAEHPFWNTRFGGSEARDALTAANIPMLLTTGYNDFYIGGMFAMWRAMQPQTRAKCAMIVSPYNHGQSYDKVNGIPFPAASVAEKFGRDYAVKWFDMILKKQPPFVQTGTVTYYRTFENRWATGFDAGDTAEISLPLSGGGHTLIYAPADAPSFPPEGSFMPPPGSRADVLTFYTPPMEKDLFVKGQMRAKLAVKSTAADTSFYIMVGIRTEKGDYALRQDITSILYQKKTYRKNQKITLDFRFDEYAFALKKGQSLRVDIAPTDKNTYICHPNKAGAYSLIRRCQSAENTVFADESFLILPVETEEKTV